MADDSDVREIPEMVDSQVPVVWSLDWPAIEKAVGHPLPSDYRRLCESLPPAKYRDLLYLLHPIASHGANLFREVARLKGTVDWLCEKERQLTEEQNAKSEQKDWEPSFQEGQLFPCFETDNGDIGFWLATDEDPDAWEIGISKDRDYYVRPTEHSLSGYLRDFLERADDDEEDEEEGIPLFTPDF